MRRWSQRKPEGFNLSFLDIMACGLGAIILVFMLVKYKTEKTDVGYMESSALQADLAGIQNEIKAIESGNNMLSAQLEKLKQRLQRQAQQSMQQDQESSAVAKEIIQLAKEIARLEQEKTKQERQREAENKIPDPVQKTHQEHLIGLRVTGQRVLILLDNSASMADERLVDIVKIKASNTAAKKSAPKWQRTIAVVNWILDRIPDGSEYMVINYNDKADFLTGQRWLKGNDASARLTVSQALGKLYPQEATNLHAALELIKSKAVNPTDIYVITDSLPTKGIGTLSAWRRLKGCGVLVGQATTVSGECRRELFYSAVLSFSKSVAAKVNAVLLPIEGDPEAARAYWFWSAATAGIMISPAGSWP